MDADSPSNKPSGMLAPLTLVEAERPDRDGSSGES